MVARDLVRPRPAPPPIPPPLSLMLAHDHQLMLPTYTHHVPTALHINHSCATVTTTTAAVAAEDISDFGARAGIAVWPRSVKMFLHYVTPSTEKRSRGTLGMYSKH